MLKRVLPLALICLAYFLLGVGIGVRSCGGKPTTAPADTVVVRDTTILYHTDTLPVRVPTLVRESQVRVDSFIAFESAPGDICPDYDLLREYADTVSTLFGRIVVHNATHRNRIVRQQLVLDSIRQLQITNTIIRTETAKPRNSVWMGMVGGYDPGTLAAYGGPSLSFEHKRGWALEVAPVLTTRAALGGQVAFRKKLSFRSPKKSQYEN